MMNKKAHGTGEPEKKDDIEIYPCALCPVPEPLRHEAIVI
jgi:hypothetical protein